MENTSNIWKLQRYARFVNTNPSLSSADNWENYDNKTRALTLRITDNYRHLIVSQGNLILESHQLNNAKATIRAVVKGDGLFVIQKILNDTRKFRVKFDKEGYTSGIESCRACSDVLTKYFPLKILPTNSDATPQDVQTTQPEGNELNGEVHISEIAKVVSGQSNDTLPLAYQQTDFASDQIGLFLRLCLTDPNFPAFVEQVEKELENIIKKDGTDT